jgi:hypothetical protein
MWGRGEEVIRRATSMANENKLSQRRIWSFAIWQLMEAGLNKYLCFCFFFVNRRFLFFFTHDTLLIHKKETKSIKNSSFFLFSQNHSLRSVFIFCFSHFSVLAPLHSHTYGKSKKKMIKCGYSNKKQKNLSKYWTHMFTTKTHLRIEHQLWIAFKHRCMISPFFFLLDLKSEKALKERKGDDCLQTNRKLKYRSLMTSFLLRWLCIFLV